MEWEEVDPGRKKREIRPREAARLGGGAKHSVTWRSPALPCGPGPARRGEGRVRRPPPRPTPSRGGREPGAGRGRSRRCLGAAGRGRRPRSARRRRWIAVRLGPARVEPAGRAVLGRAAPCGSTRPLPPVRFCLIFRLDRESAARRGLLSFPPPRTTPPSRRSPRRTPGGTQGPRPRPRSEGSRRAEERAQRRRRRGRGPAGPGRRGTSRRS